MVPAGRDGAARQPDASSAIMSGVARTDSSRGDVRLNGRIGRVCALSLSDLAFEFAREPDLVGAAPPPRKNRRSSLPRTDADNRRSDGTGRHPPFASTTSPWSLVCRRALASRDCSTNNTINSLIAGTFDVSRTITCDNLGASSTLIYQIFASAGTWDADGQSVLQASTDASNTGSIVGVQFFDANGDDITNDVAYTTGSGTQYPTVPVTSTPEPASFVLMATGLVGIAGWRRRGAARRVLTTVTSSS